MPPQHSAPECTLLEAGVARLVGVAGGPLQGGASRTFMRCVWGKVLALPLLSALGAGSRSPLPIYFWCG